MRPSYQPHQIRSVRCVGTAAESGGTFALQRAARAGYLCRTASARLSDHVVALVLEELRKELPDENTAGLMKVSRAAAWLAVHPDHVYRMVQSGELVGYPFPEPHSHMHVEVASMRALLERKRQQFEDEHTPVACKKNR